MKKKKIKNSQARKHKTFPSYDKRPQNVQSKRSNCRVDKLEQEIEKRGSGSDKSKHPIEKKTIICDLDAIGSETNSGTSNPANRNKICVNKESFQDILDKIDLVMNQLNLIEPIKEDDDETDRDRKTRIFGPYWDEFKRQSVGIVEKSLEEKNKKPSKYKDCKGNPTHNKDTGKFQTKKELDSGKKGSASFYYSCRDKLGRVGTKGRKHRWISKPDECGRSSTTNPRRKCSDFKEELISEELKARWLKLIS